MGVSFENYKNRTFCFIIICIFEYFLWCRNHKNNSYLCHFFQISINRNENIFVGELTDGDEKQLNFKNFFEIHPDKFVYFNGVLMNEEGTINMDNIVTGLTNNCANMYNGKEENMCSTLPQIGKEFLFRGHLVEDQPGSPYIAISPPTLDHGSPITNINYIHISDEITISSIEEAYRKKLKHPLKMCENTLE